MCGIGNPPTDEDERKEFINCNMNQNPRNIQSSYLRSWLKKPNGIKTKTLALG